MLERFLRFIEQKKLFSLKDRVIVTNSGGIDSMVMTRLFEMAGIEFGIAHCNFQLRGQESDEDAGFVDNYAAQNNIRLFQKNFNTRKYASDNKITIQEAARELRYDWFEELITKTGYSCYATAHQFDDQIETFFINLFRGTGISGLRGILPKNNNCVRPLLFATRKEIEEFAVLHSVKFREDSSNQKNDYLRNRIRHFVLPALQKSSPDFKTGFDNTFNLLSQVETFIQSEISNISKELVSTIDNLQAINIEKLQNYQPVEFTLFELLRPFRFNYQNVRMMMNSFGSSSGQKFLSTSHQAVLDRGQLLISPKTMDDENNKIKSVFIREGVNQLNYPVTLRLEIHSYTKGFTLKRKKNIALLDAGKLTFPLEVRQVQTGDFFYPLGLGGKKKLSDFFTNEKFSFTQKEKTWLLTSKGEIVWVIGYRTDDRFKITSATQKVLVIEYSE
ncbi:MAG: tRNA lysidine(34) synthetase TilS [Sphingobacteriia bacterium]|nr:tRNA lysidine(34) synthetase TilS [Sphingobacteriia bacterium]